MASGIHTMSPQNSINLISVYGKEEFNLHDFEENQNYTQYSFSPEFYNYVNGSRSVIKKMPLNLTSHQKTVNNNIQVKSLEQRGNNSPQECESDENSLSHSPPDNKGTKFKTAKETESEFNETCIYQPNLYQPNVRCSKNSKYYYRGGQKRFYNNLEETERKVHGLMRRFQSRAYKMKIDAKPQILLNGGPWDPLNQAIWDVFTSKIQKEETYTSKLHLWKSIFLFFRMLNNYGLYLVGSTMSGFALEGSDIDICLLTKPISSEPRIDSLHHLDYLQHALLENGLASEAELIMAKVPILKFKNKETGFEIDLNCNNIVGIQNTRLLYCYAQLDWRVRPLVVMVKIWAQRNHINDAKNMTISSYSWTLMVIHYLQCGVFPAVLPCLHSLYPEEFNTLENRSLDVQGGVEGLKDFESENTRCLGDLLIGFFHYYSYFNYQHYAISVRTGSRIPIEICKQVKSPKNDPHQWKFLCIEEPFDLSNTARSVFDLEIFKHIKQIISASYKELARNKQLSNILPVAQLNGQR
ncbi:poly(A) RNA polymerase gld-2 homolog A [Tribolium castaneum]|uniref:Poly(A) RNA polymerase gld-2 homolog A-like Protein n=1 Tax=Tribolium castaneum TaxID=7070 RepID=D6WCT7_TRICA|nr:PREDICTED: poly(A) RNA polymerase gld-2 homolog A [Tribolium castaneum]EEZ98847.1 Poly(A) RNA polymerase gld-2 homolog A-like Protein [Tribolium castaneum]|eukprot:XP_008200928.1 PREDICTED: poly(A) RNA polymerase gld-2 homolog A [Tribolium castaneum]